MHNSDCLQVMTPMDVVADQAEPMLTLTTDDGFNWMVISPPQSNLLHSPAAAAAIPTLNAASTSATSPVGMYTLIIC